MQSHNIFSLSRICLCVVIMGLAGCGGSGGSGSSGVNDDEPPDVAVNSDDCEIAQSTSISVDDKPCAPNDDPAEPVALGLDTPITATIVQDESTVYRVVSGADISLYSNTGDVDIILFDNLDEVDFDDPYNAEMSICRSVLSFKEDVCTATVPDGEMYALVVAFEDSDFSITATTACTIDTINQWAYRSLQDYYLYADQVPEVDINSYSDPSDLVRDLRFEEFDPYSGIADAAAETDFFDAGRAFGLGHRWRFDDSDNLRIITVYADSPFGRAGVKRGDIAVSLNGELLDGTMSSARFAELTGSRDNPVISNWLFIDAASGEEKNISVQASEYSLNTVLFSAFYDQAGSNSRIGYIVLSVFVEPSREELDREIEFFIDEEVDELVLDLRYNGGGRSFVSRRFASQIGGAVLNNETFARFEHNSQYSDLNFEEQFPESTPALSFDRIVVLTSDSTASASESLINTLRPYIEVITIGERTEGKAFRSYGRQFCGKQLNLMEVQGVNADGVSVVGGIPADCYAADDLARDFGQQSGSLEGMLNKGIDYLRNGACDAAPVIASRSKKLVAPQTHEFQFHGKYEN